MSRSGPAPKDPSTRVRRNRDNAVVRIVPMVAVPRPPLPEFTVQVTEKGDIVERTFNWPVMTREWWEMLDLHPLSHEFIAADWSYLMETARIHAAFWEGDMKVAGELRLRESKYGFTPEDRLKLRIQFAAATEAEIRAAETAERDSQRKKITRRPDGPDPRSALAG